jgi:hypothetical protein
MRRSQKDEGHSDMFLQHGELFVKFICVGFSGLDPTLVCEDYNAKAISVKLLELGLDIGMPEHPVFVGFGKDSS